MKIKLLIYSYITLCLVMVAAPYPAWAAPKETLTIETSQGKALFHIDLAVTPREQETGLMHRKSLPADYGMLFVWPQEKHVAMWMKDTLIPLDMLFINNKGLIVYIAPNTTPESTKNISAAVPVKAILELAGGTAEKKHIEIGDQVLHSTFKP